MEPIRERIKNSRGKPLLKPGVASTVELTLMRIFNTYFPDVADCRLDFGPARSASRAGYLLLLYLSAGYAASGKLNSTSRVVRTGPRHHPRACIERADRPTPISVRQPSALKQEFADSGVH